MKIKASILDFINTACNFIALNIVFVLSCIPLITIGTALISLYSVTMKEARGEYGYLVRTYLHEFKNNIRTGIKLFFIYSIPSAILIFNFFFWKNIGTVAASIMIVLITAAMLVLIFSSSYAFALSARFSNTLKQTVINSIGIAFANIRYTTLLLIADIFFFSAAYFSHTFRIAFIFMGFSFLAYIRSFIFIRIFKPFEV